MGKAIQYSKDAGETWEIQTELTTADITIKDDTTNDLLANRFFCIKDSDDNLYILCCYNTTYFKPKLITISKTGEKTVNQILTNLYFDGQPDNVGMTLSQDETILFFQSRTGGINHNLFYIYFSSPTTLNTAISNVTASDIPLFFGIHSDDYVWTAAGTSVAIHNYSDFTFVDSETISTVLAMCISSTNICYVISESVLTVCTFNATITTTEISCPNAFTNAKEVKIDKDGYLIILVNTGPASYLKKYNVLGEQIGYTLDLDGDYRNLNIDDAGNIYISNANITKQSAYNPVGLRTPTTIRGAGMTTYGNNITGYYPSTQV